MRQAFTGVLSHANTFLGLSFGSKFRKCAVRRGLCESAGTEIRRAMLLARFQLDSKGREYIRLVSIPQYSFQNVRAIDSQQTASNHQLHNVVGWIS